jgi:hypothetical protein
MVSGSADLNVGPVLLHSTCRFLRALKALNGFSLRTSGEALSAGGTGDTKASFRISFNSTSLSSLSSERVLEKCGADDDDTLI